MRHVCQSSLKVRRLSAASGTGQESGIASFAHSYYSSGSATLLCPVNSPANSASDGDDGSGLGAACQLSLSVRFCTFSPNTFFGTIRNGDISCVAMFSNPCEPGTDYPGLSMRNQH
jgi:hypothetical protein